MRGLLIFMHMPKGLRPQAKIISNSSLQLKVNISAWTKPGSEINTEKYSYTCQPNIKFVLTFTKKWSDISRRNLCYNIKFWLADTCQIKVVNTKIVQKHQMSCSVCMCVTLLYCIPLPWDIIHWKCSLWFLLICPHNVNIYETQLEYCSMVILVTKRTLAVWRALSPVLNTPRTVTTVIIIINTITMVTMVTITMATSTALGRCPQVVMQPIAVVWMTWVVALHQPVWSEYARDTLCEGLTPILLCILIIYMQWTLAMSNCTFSLARNITYRNTLTMHSGRCRHWTLY